jgi:hypothetical protein
MKQKQEDAMPDEEQTSKLVEAAARHLAAWTRQLKSDQIAQAEALPLRRDMVTLKHEMSQL